MSPHIGRLALQVGLVFCIVAAVAGIGAELSLATILLRSLLSAGIGALLGLGVAMLVAWLHRLALDGSLDTGNDRDPVTPAPPAVSATPPAIVRVDRVVPVPAEPVAAQPSALGQALWGLVVLTVSPVVGLVGRGFDRLRQVGAEATLTGGEEPRPRG